MTPRTPEYKNLVGHFERLGEGRLLVGDAKQILVRNDDQRVDEFFQLLDALFRDAQTALAFEGKRLRHDADGEDAHLARDPRDDGRRTRAGAAAHARGDEHHVALIEEAFDLVGAFFRRCPADIGTRSGAKALRQLSADLNPMLGFGVNQRLRVGVGDQEFDAFELRGDHVVDGIAARTADPEHKNARLEFGEIG